MGDIVEKYRENDECRYITYKKISEDGTYSYRSNKSLRFDLDFIEYDYAYRYPLDGALFMSYSRGEIEKYSVLYLS